MTSIDDEKTRVHFRKFPDGDIIALLPDHRSKDGFIDSYQTIGQHSCASASLINELEFATDEESTELKRELESIGYKLEVIQ